MSNTLFLHIGTGKTGSTALQNFLYKNSRVLERNGWCYPDICSLLPEHVQTPFESNIANGKNFFCITETLDMKSSNWVESVKVLKEKLKDSNVILSAEWIWEIDCEVFVEEMKKICDDIKILVYLRRQDLLYEAYWNQSVKYTTCEYRDIMTAFDEQWQYFDIYNYYDRLTNISKIVGKENVIVRVYEKEQMIGNGNILQDFVHVLRLQDDIFDYELDYVQRNERLAPFYLEIKRIVNENKAGSIDSWKEAIHSRNELITQKYNAAFLTPEDRRKVMKKYNEGNRKIAIEYFGREDGILFYDSKDIPRYQFPYENERDLIGLLVDVTTRQENKILEMGRYIEKLEKYTQLIGEREIDRIVKNKKVVYFGAGVKVKDCLEKKKVKVEFIVDNDLEKDGEIINNNRVLHSSKVENWFDLFVIITTYNTVDIEKQLMTLGLKKEENYILAKEYWIDIY